MKTGCLYFAAATLALASLGAAPGSIAQEALIVAEQQSPNTLDPHANNGIPTASHASNFYDPLLVTDRSMTLQPALAESWENPDPTTWIFHLRPGVKFHNGAPLTAEDVKFSIDRVVNWEAFAGFGGVGYINCCIASTRVIDDLTVEVTTSEPFGPILRSLRTTYIVNKEHTEKIIADEGVEAVGQQAMGTGAFKLVEWVKGDRLTMERNDDWWGGEVGVPRVIFREISNQPTRVAALLSGEIHIAAELPPRDVQRVDNGDDTKAVLLDGMRTVGFRFDTIRDETPGVPGMANPLLDRRVRKAISHAIDADAIVKIVMDGKALTNTQMAGRHHFGFNPGIERPEHNIELGKQLLAEAGYEDGFPLTIDSSNNRYVNDEQICLAVAQMVNQVNIQATCRARPVNVFGTAIYRQGDQGEGSMWIFSHVTPTADIAGNLESNFHTNDGVLGTFNPGYTNPAVDSLIELANQTTDEAERRSHLQAAVSLIMEDAAYLPLHYQFEIYGMRSNVDWEPRPDSFMTMYDAKLN